MLTRARLNLFRRRMRSLWVELEVMILTSRVLHKVPLLSSRPVSRNPGSTEALIKKTTKADGTLVVDDSRAGEALRNP